MEAIAEPYIQEERYILKKELLFWCWNRIHTAWDTAASCAVEINADVIIKGTRVDGGLI
jgi:uridylate kinase